MSRIGKQIIPIPENVKITFTGSRILVDGPLGSLSRVMPFLIRCSVDEENNSLILEKTEDTKLARVLYGLSRTLIANMFKGVTVGFEKRLLMTGVGYRAELNNSTLILYVGYSHPLKMVIPLELVIRLESPTSFVVFGMVKSEVGNFAARIRAISPSDPYKGKGIAYEDEIIKRKAGKTGK
jgi:large subunit ribosomal protein L6